jgi:hypothetical protein
MTVAKDFGVIGEYSSPVDLDCPAAVAGGTEIN